MKYFTFLFLFSLLFLNACSDSNEREQLLYGRWNATKWETKDLKQKYPTDNIYFDFKNDNTYKAQLGDREEKGTWKVKSDLLYTHASDFQEIATQILSIDSNQFVMQMNRGGLQEVMTLQKVK